MRKLFLALPLLVGACSTSQVSELQAVCAEAVPLAVLAAPIPTVGPFIAAGVQVGCTTSSGLAKLASDPSSVEWLTQQVSLLKQALGKAP